jgi:peptidyl-prolyl cis-trans isomerase C
MISVNGVKIPEEAVAGEMQHHPSASREEAAQRAATALVLRELLLQRARDREIAGADEEQLIENLIALEVLVPEPRDDEIERYYRRNSLKFMTSPLYEAAHIFFPAREGAAEERARAKASAEALLATVTAEPGRFAELARAFSACSSKENGGSLGQVGKGDTNPELERAFATMDEGAIALVASRHGFHVVRLDRRLPAREVPLEMARDWIARHLREASTRRATAQYLQLLAARAKISGVELAAADSPLVQ